MTPQQRRTVLRLAPTFPVILFATWSLFTGHQRVAAILFPLLVLWFLIVELWAVAQGGQSTESELTWNVWATEPWVIWLLSVMIARAEAWYACQHFGAMGSDYLWATELLIPVLFLCGHFFAQSSNVYDQIRRSGGVIVFLLLVASAQGQSADMPVFPSPQPLTSQPTGWMPAWWKPPVQASPSGIPSPLATASPVPSPAPIEAMRIWAGAGAAVVVGDAISDPAPLVVVSVDGPIPFGHKAPFRLNAELTFSELPSKSFDLTSIVPVKDLAVTLAAYREFGHVTAGNQIFSNAVVVEYGWDNAVQVAAAKPMYAVIGLRLAEETSASDLYLTAGWIQEGGATDPVLGVANLAQRFGVRLRGQVKLPTGQTIKVVALLAGGKVGRIVAGIVQDIVRKH